MSSSRATMKVEEMSLLKKIIARAGDGAEKRRHVIWGEKMSEKLEGKRRKSRFIAEKMRAQGNSG